MPIRISGLTSGLDTESIVGALVSAYSYKKDKYVKAQTKVSWKQEAWKSLNSKVYNLYTSVGNLRYSSSYSVKKAQVSDTTKATATASGNAITGTQTLEIKQLARTAYITGAELDSTVTGRSTLADLGVKTGSSSGTGSIQVRTSTGTKTIEVDGSTTIDQLTNKLAEAGLQASYDEKNHRFFVSATKSGKAGDFSITANNDLGLKALSSVGLLTSSDVSAISDDTSSASLAQRTYKLTDSSSLTSDKAGFVEFVTKFKEKAAELAEARAAGDAATPEQQELIARADALDEKFGETFGTDGKIDWENISDEQLSDLADAMFSNATYDDDAATATSSEISTAINAIRDAYLAVATASTKTYDSVSAKEQAIEEAKAARDAVLADSTNAKWAKYIQENFGTVNSDSSDPDSADSYSNFWTQSDNAELAQSVVYRVDLSAKVAINGESFDVPEGKEAHKIDGLDAIFTLNEVDYTSDTNTLTVNGLTVEAVGLTGDNPITITVNNDTDGIYDKVKDFLTTYNSLMNEMQKLYNADSAKDYEPLTDDEKAEMSESQIEKWEQKIKDSLLRRDQSLSSIISAMTTSMMQTYEVNGKTYAWSSFGVHTLGSLNAEKNEGYAYHIDGDSEDSSTSGQQDKLRVALAEDPDAVIDFLKQMASGLYSKLDEKMKSTSVKSVYTVYNDKEMASEYSNYSQLIKTWTDRVKDMEDSYYKKFSKMESALAKLQSNSSSLTSMLGGG